MPAYEIRGMDISLKAGEDLSAKQFYIVKLSSTTDNMALCGDSDIPLGILQDDPESGQTGSVRIHGLSKCVAGAAILSGYEIAVDSQGRGVVATTGDYVVGLAMTAVSNAGERFTIKLGGVPEKA